MLLWGVIFIAPGREGPMNPGARFDTTTFQWTDYKFKGPETYQKPKIEHLLFHDFHSLPQQHPCW